MLVRRKFAEKPESFREAKCAEGLLEGLRFLRAVTVLPLLEPAILCVPLAS